MGANFYPRCRAGKPEAKLNTTTLARGRVLVTVDFGEGGYLAFNSADEVRPWVAAMAVAVGLAEEAEDAIRLGEQDLLIAAIEKGEAGPQIEAACTAIAAERTARLAGEGK